MTWLIDIPASSLHAYHTWNDKNMITLCINIFLFPISWNFIAPKFSLITLSHSSQPSDDVNCVYQQSLDPNTLTTPLNLPSTSISIIAVSLHVYCTKNSSTSEIGTWFAFTRIAFLLWKPQNIYSKEITIFLRPHECQKKSICCTDVTEILMSYIIYLAKEKKISFPKVRDVPNHINTMICPRLFVTLLPIIWAGVFVGPIAITSYKPGTNVSGVTAVSVETLC